LPSNDREIHAHTHTDYWEGFLRYATGMDSDAMIYFPSFVKIDLGIQIFKGRGTERERERERDINTQRQHDDLISFPYYFKIKKEC
jgi:hypothetical protein